MSALVPARMVSILLTFCGYTLGCESPAIVTSRQIGPHGFSIQN
jgi:hypothetical protein